MRKFHITVTNNETGDIVHDSDTDAIVGAYAVEDGVYAIGMTACDALTLMTTIQAAKNAAEKCVENDPLLRLLADLADRIEGNGLEDADEPNDTTDTDN